jgi:acetylornithine deacetylase
VHPVQRDGVIYGRGSADVKGFLACILAAVEDKPVERFAQPLAIVLTADEEIGCLGAKHLAAQSAFRAQHAIVGEPTELTPIRGGKGYGLGQIVVRGKEAHSAFPAQGRSAIYDAARVISALERVAKELEDEPNGDFDPPFTTLNVGLIEGGTAKNIVAGECRLTVEWRPVPGQDAEFAPALIRHELMRLQVLSGVSAEFEVLRADPPFAPSATQDLAELLEALTRIPPSTVAFGTEAAHISALADDVVVFGPGSMSTAHQSGEHVPVVQLDYCVRFLQAAMARYCAIPNEERS